MSEKRGAEEIRKEIAAERERLDADLSALQAELRSLVPLVVACPPGKKVSRRKDDRVRALRELRRTDLDDALGRERSTSLDDARSMERPPETRPWEKDVAPAKTFVLRVTVV
jgi:hypothetical protein